MENNTPNWAPQTPPATPPQKNPYKTKYFIALGAAILLLLIVVIQAVANTSDPQETPAPSATALTSTNLQSGETTPAATKENISAAPTTTAKVTKPAATESAETRNCRKKAEQYLKTLSFSKTGLVKQLVYEGYSKTIAQNAVDNLDVDWKKQCALKAEQYLKTSAFSKAGLRTQLEYEGFTSSEIDYGIEAAYE
ncbi:MAG: Ltp family lipoprotein [Oscillospiraceae bacterium]|nr:Ltp family lipoprotein [Oscillospiraceae bacterium]